MNQTAKGVFAASTAAVLFLGGAGSLAYWNDTATVPGAVIGSGQLSLDSANCAAAGWKVSNTVENVTNAPFNVATEQIVPGDVLTKTCTVTVVAAGTNLRANLAVTGGGTTTSTMASSAYTVTSAFTLGGVAISSITDSNNNATIDTVLTVAFPIKSTVDNTSKLKSINLDTFTITATQATA